MRKTIILFFFWIAYIRCTSEIDIAIPELEPQVVLNGIIHPQSIIQVSLTHSLLPDDNQVFNPIDKAEIVLYENNILVGTFSFNDTLYQINHYPKEGNRYTIEASVPNSTQITRASDIVPYLADTRACFTQQDYLYSDINVSTTILDNANTEDFYWLDVLNINYPYYDCEFVREDTSTYYCLGRDSSRLITKQEYPLSSYSTVPDRFNAFADNTSGGITNYDAYIRISDEGIEGEEITIDLTGYSQLFRYNVLSNSSLGQSLILNVTNASQHYDRYLKSSLIYYRNNGFEDDNEDTPNPFSEPTRIYSNVENGLGIFAAYNSVRIAVEDFPCQ